MFNVGDKVNVNNNFLIDEFAKTGTVIINDDQWVDERYANEVRYTVLLDKEENYAFRENESVIRIPTDYRVEGKRYIFALESEMELLEEQKPETTIPIKKENGVTFEELLEAVDKLRFLEKELESIDEDIKRMEDIPFNFVSFVINGEVKSSYEKYKISDFLNQVKTARGVKRLECVEQRKRIESFIK